ncbi:MAG: hypothetical protein CR982_06900 [Candidatus Cloacimonadota bacterium]|nr:MAG: hypothetical protein CR982_06900 [Candidatus Cloacimonadota bacterium]PIE77788.1 MAG: hypothetical protein CSA15_10865 [Candidatus Delongbacteria bacterium]
MDIFKGYILSAESIITENKNIIKLSGYDNKGSFIIYLTGIKNNLFIKSETKNIEIENNIKREKSKFKNLKDEPLDIIYINDSSSIYTLKENLEENGILTYESDLRIVEKFFIRTGIKGYIKFRGKYKLNGNVKIFINPEIEASKKFDIDLLSSSIDIETSLDNDLYSIACYNRSSSHKSEIVFMIGKGYEDKDNILFYDDEKSLLKDFIQYIKNLDPDLIFGWHVIGFDLKFLERKCQQYDIKFSLGRDNSEVLINEKKGSGYFCDIFGRQVIDGPQTLRSSGYSFKNFKLETVATEIVGASKDIASDEGKVDEITRRFNEDKFALAKYNILDCKLVTDIYNKLDIVNSLLEKSYQCGVLLDKLGLVNAIMDNIIIGKLYELNYISPNQTSTLSSPKVENVVIREAVPGKYNNVAKLSFENLKANIIRFFSIDFYSKLKNLTDRVETPNREYFSSTESILPKIITKTITDKNLMESTKQFLIKTIISGLNNHSNRFYTPKVIESIEKTCEWIVNRAIDWFKNRGFNTILADDSEILISQEFEIEKEKLEEYVIEFKREINSKILREYGVNSNFNIIVDSIYDSIIVPKTGFKSQKKSYIYYREEKFKFNLMEYGSSDYCNYGKKYGDKLLEAIFKGEDFENIVIDYSDRLSDGDYEIEDLYFKNKLPRKIDREKENQSAQIQAAMKLNNEQLRFKREIEYIVCEDGFYPKEVSPTKIDINFYKEKQVKTLTNAILFCKDIKYEDIIYGNQLTLF